MPAYNKVWYCRLCKKRFVSPSTEKNQIYCPSCLKKAQKND